MNLKEIKNWDNQKLIDAHNNNQDFYPFNTIDFNRIETELLSRLEQIDDLKCCGNCESTEGCEFSTVFQSKYCDKWQSDGMTRKERMIK